MLLRSMVVKGGWGGGVSRLARPVAARGGGRGKRAAAADGEAPAPPCAATGLASFSRRDLATSAPRERRELPCVNDRRLSLAALCKTCHALTSSFGLSVPHAQTSWCLLTLTAQLRRWAVFETELGSSGVVGRWGGGHVRCCKGPRLVGVLFGEGLEEGGIP